MKTIYQLQQIANRLRQVTEVNSISPEDTFGLQSDILEYLADMEQNAEGLGIHKVYASYAAMVADASAPVGSNGKALRFGQLVAVYNSSNTTQAESGNVYAWQKGNTGAAAWLLMGNLSSLNVYTKEEIDNRLTPATYEKIGFVKPYTKSVGGVNTNRSGLNITEDGQILVNVQEKNGLFIDGSGQLKTNIQRSATSEDINKIGEATAPTEAAVTTANLPQVLKTINNLPIYGQGNINIEGGATPSEKSRWNDDSIVKSIECSMPLEYIEEGVIDNKASGFEVDYETIRYLKDSYKTVRLTHSDYTTDFCLYVLYTQDGSLICEEITNAEHFPMVDFDPISTALSYTGFGTFDDKTNVSFWLFAVDDRLEFIEYDSDEPALLIGSGNIDGATKQDKLISRTNIKTVNNQSILGGGNIDANDIFIAKYNVTGFADIKSAYDAGKLVICDYSINDTFFGFCIVTGVSTTNITFEGVLGTIAANLEKLVLRVSDTNTWTKTGIYLQQKLTSGTNIKTINGQSVLGSGNINIEVSSTPATTTTLGVVKLHTSGSTNRSGLLIDSSGGLSVNINSNNGGYIDGAGQLHTNIVRSATDEDLINKSKTAAITPFNLEQALEMTTPIILEIEVGTDRFVNVSDFEKVHEKMQNGEYVNFCIQSVYASGVKYMHYPTTVKPNYISLSSKAGNCELHVNDDGSFTISGTKPW